VVADVRVDGVVVVRVVDVGKVDACPAVERAAVDPPCFAAFAFWPLLSFCRRELVESKPVVPAPRPG